MVAPQPLVLKAAVASSLDPKPISLDLSQVAGYSAGATQTLKHIAGVLTWVTDV